MTKNPNFQINLENHTSKFMPRNNYARHLL